MRYYDKRTAEKLAKAKIIRDSREVQLSWRDLLLVKASASKVAKTNPDAKLISFHKRTKRIVWSE